MTLFFGGLLPMVEGLASLCLGGGEMEEMLVEMEEIASGIYRKVGEWDEASHDYPMLWITRTSWNLE
jgi:hypothetical protein